MFAALRMWVSKYLWMIAPLSLLLCTSAGSVTVAYAS